MSRSRNIVVALVAGATALTGAVTASFSASASGRTAQDVLDQMTLAQRVGQLFMVGTPATGASAATLRTITRQHVGSVILTGRSHRGVAATAQVSAALQSRTTAWATDGVRLFVATDQEGGEVQVLNGTGFADIPTALVQGRWVLSRLHDDAVSWGRQLHRAGVNLDLAPVLDTVPSPRAAAHNPPIGWYDREFGYTTKRVGNHGRAFLRGMDAAGVATSGKHFPGLGRVHANTDITSGVTDRVTRRHDPYFAPFEKAVRAGLPVMMMSTAYYSRLDPKRPAAFSPYVIGTILRGDLGFRGVVVSDSLDTPQVGAWKPGRRATMFVHAGGDLALVTDPRVLPAMYDAVLTRARTYPAFARLVNRAALRVLTAKQHYGLLS
ncbi:MAG TPA: glycoside hydrolase family 3 N-terminal domain-containing protein [Marmoricola sp.]|nr:glycoside hydrolase family 3 N-terminal domain-containing protein [Marmoricola sp.]